MKFFVLLADKNERNHWYLYRKQRISLFIKNPDLVHYLFPSKARFPQFLCILSYNKQ